jgi:hypothetical protein
MAKVKKAVKKSQKKVVKKRIALKAPGRIQNIDMIEYFKSGEKKYLEDWAFIEGNVLSCITHHPNNGDTVPAAIKVGGYTVINGDDVVDGVGDFSDVIGEIQSHGDKEITTSFVCLKNAGIDLQKVRVLDITQDLDVNIKHGDKGFEEFDSTVPQGATLTSYINDNYNLSPGDKNYSEEEANRIVEKRYHRAGSMLIREGKHSYICGMDEDSYFVTKLPKNVSTIDKAFQSLKPKAVQQWEKKNKTQARRQGEWFFLPTELTKVKGMRRKGLPLWKDGGNKHIAQRYAVVDDKNYVSGNVTHVDHFDERLGKVIHEAIMNTALGSWSEQGVD